MAKATNDKAEFTTVLKSETVLSVKGRNYFVKAVADKENGGFPAGTVTYRRCNVNDKAEFGGWADNRLVSVNGLGEDQGDAIMVRVEKVGKDDKPTGGASINVDTLLAILRDAQLALADGGVKIQVPVAPAAK